MQKLKSAIKRNPTLKKYYNIAFELCKLIKRLVTTGMYMVCSYLVLEDKKVVYMVMQKAASTTIKASMVALESDKDFVTVNKTIRKMKYVVPKLDPVAHKGFFMFTFVRNPFERLISCYENKYHTDKGLRADATKYDGFLLGYISKDRGFLDFARRVCRIPDRISEYHFVSQSFRIDRMSRVLKPDFVGHYEHLAEEYEPIRERFGFMPLPHHNKTPKKQMWMDYYDIPTAKMVYKRYREDIERYGYRETYDQLIEHLTKRDASIEQH